MKFSRDGKIGVTSDDQKILIEPTHLYRKTFCELVVAVGISQPKREAPRMNAAPVAADAPVRVELIQILDRGVELLSIVLQEQQILMTKENIDSPGNGQEFVDSRKGLYSIRL